MRVLSYRIIQIVFYPTNESVDMQFLNFSQGGHKGLAVSDGSGFTGLMVSEAACLQPDQS